MNVFVAGASGVIGQPLLKLLRAAGHVVTGTTRSQSKIATIESLGARGLVADAFDANAMRRAVVAAWRSRPKHRPPTPARRGNPIGKAHVWTPVHRPYPIPPSACP